MSDTETAYAWFDGAVRQTVTARPDSSTTWQTQHTLDARGRVTQASISDGRPRTVAFVYNDENEILNRVETGSGSPWTTRSHYVAGKVIDADPLTASTDTDSADGQIVVREGDTLQTLAASNWGDATLWYLIAERNGLSGSETLEAGQVIWLPANVNRSRNAADTFTPYDPNKAMGRLDPTQPKPTERPGGCGVVGQIMTAVVAIAVTVIAGPVLGNLAGQAFGLATGNQDQFSWKSLGLSVLASGVNAVMKTVVETGLKLTGTAAAIVSATASNVVTQGIGVATGLQDRFDWTGVAASALMAGVDSEVGQAADRYMSADAAQFASSTASAFAGAATRTLLDGTSFGDNIIAVLPDVIGQTIGNAVAGGIQVRAEAAAKNGVDSVSKSGGGMPSQGPVSEWLINASGDVVRPDGSIVPRPQGNTGAGGGSSDDWIDLRSHQTLQPNLRELVNGEWVETGEWGPPITFDTDEGRNIAYRQEIDNDGVRDIFYDRDAGRVLNIVNASTWTGLVTLADGRSTIDYGDTAQMDDIVVTASPSRKEIIARGGSGYQITVAPNPTANGSAPWFETGVSMVRANEKYIPAAAKKYQVDADLIRSVIFVESSHGYYDYLLQLFDENKSILPMNINTSYWGDTWGSRKALKEPRANIEAGAAMLRSISNSMPGASVAQIATVYNASNAHTVSDYGARVQTVYDNKSWNLPNFSTEDQRR